MSTIRVGNIGPLTGNTSVIADPGGVGGMSLVSMSAVTASGTSVDFTGIPSWARRITVIFNGLSTTGSSSLLIRLGSSGGVESTGYVSSAIYAGASQGGATNATGFIAFYGNGASDTLNSVMTIFNSSGNSWVASYTGGFGIGQSYASAGAGNKTLSSVLDRVRITTINGTDTFDAGTVNVMYE